MRPKRVGLYLVDSNSKFKPDFYISLDNARLLRKLGLARAINNGKAVRVGIARELRLIGKAYPKDRSRAYDQIGLEKYPHEILGGLTRTEYQPRDLPLYRSKIWRIKSAFTT